MPFPFSNAFKYFMIDPMTDWERFFNPQFYITYNTGDVDVENNVLREVGSYGKQIGQILDMLNVLVARLPQEDLTPRERYVLDQFHTLTKDVNRAVAAIKGPEDKGITRTDVEQLISDLQSLERTNPEAHRLLVERLQNTIGKATKNRIENQGYGERHW
jgi:hypothetical protein